MPSAMVSFLPSSEGPLCMDIQSPLVDNTGSAGEFGLHFASDCKGLLLPEYEVSCGG